MKYHVALYRVKNILLTATCNGGTIENFRAHLKIQKNPTTFHRSLQYDVTSI